MSSSPPNLSPAELVDVILNATVEASEEGQEASLPLDEITDRNEQWVQSYIAVRLNDCMRAAFGSPTGIFVTHEARVSWMREVTHARARPGRPTLTSAQRFDLAIWDRDYVVGLVEVKNAPGMDRVRFGDDPRRLVQALDRWGITNDGSLRWAAHVFSVRLTRSAAARADPDALERLYDDRLASLSELCANRTIEAAFRRSNDGADCLVGWGVVVIT